MNAEKVYSLEEQKANRKLWVEALRSGKYTQGHSFLQAQDGAMCCLGVACDISGLGHWLADGGSDPCRDFMADGCTHPSRASLPKPVMDWLGVRDNNGGAKAPLFRGEFTYLTSANDGGVTFAEIANIIEAEPDGLFLESLLPVPAKSEV